MTSKAALCLALLEGRVLNIKNGFELLGITNIPREIGRSIEREEDGGFGVIVSRTHMEGKSRYGQPCTWTNYRLNKSAHNLPGIEKMKAYIKEQMGSGENLKTQTQQKKFQQTELFLETI